MKTITFFKRLRSQILSGKKQATIRDESDSDYQVGDLVQAFTYEDNQPIATLKICQVTSVHVDDLTKEHAKAENLPFVFLLKWVIRRIYPKQTQLFFIEFTVMNNH